MRLAAKHRDAAALALGFALDRAFGDPAARHPVAGFGAVAAMLERHTWRPSRVAGILHVALLLGAVGALARRIEANPICSALLVWATLGGRSLERAALTMVELLQEGKIDAARKHAPVLVGRDPRQLDAPELCRAAIESVAENTTDAVVGALWWGALAGAPGAAVYRATNTLDAMIGHRNHRYERFGWAAARLDDALTWPAARLTTLLSVVLAPLAGGEGGAALRIARRDGARHPSPNAGLIEASFAGALGVRLGGANRYGTHTEHRPTLGDGRPPAPSDVARAAALSRLVGAASALVCVSFALARRW